jgi:hypothetical protein
LVKGRITMDIRDQITVSSAEPATPVDTPTIETPTETPTVSEAVDSNTDVIEKPSEQATTVDTPSETGQSNIDDKQEVKKDITKEDRVELGKKVEKKIGKLTKAKAKANERAEDALRRLQIAEQTIAKLKSQEVDIESMSFDERIKHSVDSQLAETQANEAINSATEDYNNSGQEVWNEKLESAKSKYTDYADVVSKSSVPIKPEVATAIKESDVGAEMIYQIASNPELGQELYRASPLRAAVLLQSLEQSIGSNPVLTKQESAPAVAPTPTLNVAPAQKPAQNIAQMGMEDFMAMKQNQIKSRRR